MRLAEPEMTGTKKRNYLGKVIKDADTRRRQAVVTKTNAANALKRGEITKDVRDSEYRKSDKLQRQIKDYMKHYQ